MYPAIGQLSLPSIRDKLIECRPLAGVKVMAECVHLRRIGWQETLCNPIWQVTFRSSDTEFY